MLKQEKNRTRVAAIKLLQNAWVAKQSAKAKEIAEPSSINKKGIREKKGSLKRNKHTSLGFKR